MFSAQGRDRKVELKKADVDTDGGEWCQLGSKFQLRLQQANGSSLRFDGFEAATFKELKEYCDKTFGVKLAKVAMDVSGRNSGKLDVRGDELVLRGSLAFGGLQQHAIEQHDGGMAADGFWKSRRRN